MTIELRDHDPRWPAAAQTAAEELTTALPGLFPAVEHVGSTAIAGLAAKPVIDLMAATAALDAVVAVEEVLRRLGYRRLETGMRERLFYRRDGEPAYHLHVVTADSWDTRNERLLRDHLLRHPEDRDAYGALKGDLAAAGHDGAAYTRAKTDLIQRMVDAARTRRGLPLVDVWED
ncbi:GrpB family protein [Dactylosporangium aurantiacum]|uniref:GrpB family protein n=1 Tax=Dactylosporangium aurantiacum TaxID=35754 RepID=A0A9Q9I6F1_9ACTN|nr:GrpB family protein [Dactylosporangium aurantiacum]MDG6106476.1 GrpB family protein [Dactylosporangium aurantiacum]UWZ50489.1 GrpB family protein [Dactylosporangium aurantiacum]